MKKRTIYKDYFVIININTFEVSITRYRSTLADIVGVSKTTASTIRGRTTFRDFVIIPVTES